MPNAVLSKGKKASAKNSLSSAFLMLAVKETGALIPFKERFPVIVALSPAVYLTLVIEKVASPNFETSKKSPEDKCYINHKTTPY